LGHIKQSNDSEKDCLEYVPSGHAEGRTDPSGQNEPTGHLIQSAEKSKTTNALKESILVFTEILPEKGELQVPVVNCPAAKVMDCAPAGSTAVAVVHTMTRVAAVIAHPDNVAPPDTGLSEPTGVAGPVK
jgi:hypothetical protein